MTGMVCEFVRAPEDGVLRFRFLKGGSVLAVGLQSEWEDWWGFREAYTRHLSGLLGKLPPLEVLYPLYLEAARAREVDRSRDRT